MYVILVKQTFSLPVVLGSFRQLFERTYTSPSLLVECWTKLLCEYGMKHA
jgi:hypothetical protein